jgi:PAS domain S-box-containing protein
MKAPFPKPETLHHILSGLDDLIWTIDQNYRVLNVNSAIERLLGYTAEEIKNGGDAWLKLIHPEDLEKTKTFFNDVFEGKNATCEGRMFHKNGQIVWLHSRATYSVNNLNQNVFEGISIDITQKIRDAEIIAEKDKLLLAASKFSALGEMSATMAHEIKNPLSVISNCAGYLLALAESDEPLDKAVVVEYAEKIEETVIKTSKIIQSLRAFARDGKKDPFTPNSARTILDDVLAISVPKFEKDNIALKVGTVPEGSLLNCRSSEIFQVLVNLLNNACDAVAELPEKWVEISYSDTPEFGEFWITDSGQGIPKEIQKKIFDPFFTTKSIGKGTGIGLSLSSKIIHEHNGLLIIDNTCKNTRFIVRIPKAPSQTQAA